jgi:hypothetical protein
MIRLMMAALALISASMPNAALAQDRQGRGRWVATDRPAVETPTDRNGTASGKQVLIETSEGVDDLLRSSNDKGVIRIDVSENAKRFIFDETPLHDDGAPAYGNEFVTEGYIYPYGTLDGTNGVNPDGSPEFPQLVIGRWTCRGWHVGEGAKTATGPWVVTHQLFDFGARAGDVTLATDGVELVDIGVPVKRAIIGGTGPYAEARGEAVQNMIGFNQLNGVNLRLEIKVSKK